MTSQAEYRHWTTNAWLVVRHVSRLKDCNILNNDDFYSKIIQQYNIKYTQINKIIKPMKIIVTYTQQKQHSVLSAGQSLDQIKYSALILKYRMHAFLLQV